MWVVHCIVNVPNIYLHVSVSSAFLQQKQNVENAISSVIYTIDLQLNLKLSSFHTKCFVIKNLNPKVIVTLVMIHEMNI